MNDAEQELIAGLEEFIADLKNGVPILEKYSSRQRSSADDTDAESAPNVD